MASTPATMLHVVTQGLQDRARLNPPRGAPSLKYYTSVIRRSTRWASRWRRVDFDGIADFGRRATVTLDPLDDLITRATLVVELPDIVTSQYAAFVANAYNPVEPAWNWTNGLGHAICNNVEFQINGSIIDQFDSRLLEVLDEQHAPVEHFDSTNTMLHRNPSTYTGSAPITPSVIAGQGSVQTLEVIFPFWWNRGTGPQALPIRALGKDKVQITVDFRPVQQCVFTESVASAALPGAGGPLPAIAGCPFLDRATGVPVAGNPTMPTSYHLTAYWIIEYVSLEERESSALRQAHLQIPVEQHVAVPVFRTESTATARVPIEAGGLIRDMMWVAQRPEAADYNAYFLFSRELGETDASGRLHLWWPDARIPNWDYGDGYLRPGFADRRADPIAAATLWYKSDRRFEHEGATIFRSLMPALNCRRTPLIDRYIYRYDFGFWPTGGLADALDRDRDEVRGAANWSLMPRRELFLHFNGDECRAPTWMDLSDQTVTLGSNDIVHLESLFGYNVDAYRVRLAGASPGGRGAYVEGIVDYQTLRRVRGFRHVYARTNRNGSASLVLQTEVGGVTAYSWIAVAGGGGYGAGGGNAGSAITIGGQGGTGVPTHADNERTTTFANAEAATAVGYRFNAPAFTVTTAGEIRSWQVRTAAWTAGLAHYIVINGIRSAPIYVPAPTPNTVRWVTVTPLMPVTVNPGDSVYVYHTSQLATNTYTSAVDGSGAAVFTLEVVSTQGGGGGGRDAAGGAEPEGVGLPDGAPMTVAEPFVLSHTETGGTTDTNRGGDGYYGGGSGWEAGGGGSYVGPYISHVGSDVVADVGTGEASATITPLRLTSAAATPAYNVYIWLTRINMLSITSGHGALMMAV
jgi:hypothetical protein